MTQKEFIEVLKKKGYSYEIQGDKIIVTENGNVWLESLTSIPSGVEFRNEGYVRLVSLIGGDFNEWEGNIEGIYSTILLNKMISKGVFKR